MKTTKYYLYGCEVEVTNMTSARVYYTVVETGRKTFIGMRNWRTRAVKI
jgi:hypothetical protein